ncbi:hypothetical protein GO002_33010 [Streptomyces eurocidicus]|uniref:Uncharacterized protein n=1 Tax=Streptomyces eurocidicus TaxID=66423 RepID=A0A7W8BJS0_STREU|nr:hypothetical protein [Streptomyces eurocidicus]MBB5123253.1 hypothetical protein [Streptomyces eurocidicus]MBF6056634.1 hypothetical protein [Streptomyces eurocidicus]
MSKFTLRLTANWEDPLFLSPEMRDLVELHTLKLTESAVAAAPEPKRPTKAHWNTIRHHIKPHLALGRAGWYGQVVVEVDARLRHAMLQERGWTDRKGRPRAGRWFLKRALEEARVE